MTRLIFVNKVGKNENNYIVGTTIGRQSRFVKSALKKRSSNNSQGLCCDYRNKSLITPLIISYVVRNINLSDLDDTEKQSLINQITNDYASYLNISSDFIVINLIQGSLIIHVTIKSDTPNLENIKNVINNNASINDNVKDEIKNNLETVISGTVSIEEPIISDEFLPSITEICITPRSVVKRVPSNGNKYVFNNSSTYNPFFRYSLNNGYYEFINIPEDHAMAILNNNKTSLITYTGDSKKLTIVVSGTTADGTYDFYYGTIKVYVYGDFDSVSVFCYQHGYMGGENLLTYKNSCSSININNPPTFTSTQVTSATEGSVYTYTVTTSDPDNDSITLSAPVLPSWLSLTSGVLSGTPTNSDVGNHNVTLRANDGIVDVDQTFVITVNSSTSQTYTINVVGYNNYYTLNGDDREGEGSVSGTHANVVLNTGDTVNFIVSMDSYSENHPFFIKNSSNSDVSLNSGTQGTTDGTLTWTPTSIGTYYYICSRHITMSGDIIVS